jgi:proteasome lid subunit RPN8/RPN11
VVFWAAPKEMYGSSVAVATTVVVPAQRVSPGGFELAPEVVRAMGADLRRRGLVNLVQVHTHPGAGIGHSGWDDSHVFSQREGTLS